MDLLITLVILIIVVGLIYWAVNQLAGAFGIPAPIVTVINVLLVIVVVIYLLQLLRGGGFSLGL